MNNHDISTQDLLLQLKSSGEQCCRDAMELLYQRFMRQLYWYGRRCLLSDDDAASAAQDTLLRIYRCRHIYDECKGTGEGWIWAIHQRIVIDWLRKQRPEIWEKLDESLPSPENTSPEQHFESREKLEYILQAWNRLDESDKKELQNKKPGPVSRARRDAEKRFRMYLSEEIK